MRGASWLRSQLLVAVMAVGSSNCSSLPAQDLELEREMKIYIHDAASSLEFNLKTEQEENIFLGFVSLPTGFGKSLCYICYPK